MKRNLISKRFSRLLFAAVFILFNAAVVYSENSQPAQKPVNSDIGPLADAFVKVTELLKPAVANIFSTQKIEIPEQEFFFGGPFDFFENYREPGQKRQYKQPKKYYNAEGSGSGVIISNDGYILTNEHVIHEADEIKVRVFIKGEEKTLPAKIVGKDSRTDLAVVKIDAKDLQVASLGDSDKLHVGEWALAIGSPFGLEQTVTSGIISAIRQSITVEGKMYKDFIQTDAAINRGNSGGPLCNIYGEVIGINTAIYAPTGVFSGVGFAIPINRAKEILNDLIHKGKVVRGWLGIEIKPVDDAIKKQFNLPAKEGALINNVMQDTPASKYGLKRGDVIREFDGKQVKSPQELQSAVSATEPKKKVKIKVIRNS
ncbi:MAG: trypsin-like peptidase domain-containing protein, partial [Candidatus Omnitrophica bacterium]|nr:trypsin-like peptidase domain-containing protein [Candidatus Omnitrophota bacterium]